MADEKRFPASRRKLQKARKDGDVAKSSHLSAAFVLSVGIIYVFSQERKIAILCEFMQKTLGADADFHTNNMLVYAAEALCLTLEFLLPFLLAVCLGAVLAEAVQVGLIVSVKPLVPSFEKLNLFQGLKRLCAIQPQTGQRCVPFEVCKLTIVLIMFLLAFLLILSFFGLPLLEAPLEDLAQVYEASDFLLRTVSVSAFGLLLALGGIELMTERSKRAKRLRMDIEEFRREHRESEGDPELRGMRRQLHQELLIHSVTQDVRHSKVVVVGRS